MTDRQRTVAELRPRAGLALDPELSVKQASMKMQAAASDSALIVSAAGELKGILTDTDVARKVVALGLDPESTPVSQIMTTSPQCVRATENAVDALCTMVERRFRHLPVLDANGAVVGVLDIAKCLYDAISRLERHLTSASSALSHAVLAAMPLGHASGGSAQQLVDGMVHKLFSPSLGDLLATAANARTAAGLPWAAASVAPTDTAQAAAALMAQRKSAIVISSATEPVAGIATPKDLLFRLVARGLDGQTPIGELMTPKPDTMPGSATVLQALHQLQYGGYRNVPVVGESGEALGVLDVLTLMEGALLNNKTATNGKQGASEMSRNLRGFWNSAESLVGGAPAKLTSQPPSRPTSQPPSVPASAANVQNAPAPASVNASTAVSATSTTERFLFKVIDPESEGHMHRIHSHPRNLGALVSAVRSKMALPADAALVLRYDDDESDRVMITSDEELAEAVSLSMRTGRERLVVYATLEGGATVAATGGTSKAMHMSQNQEADKENAAGASLGGTAARIAGKAMGGGKLSADEKLLGASAMLAALVVGVGALARR